MAYRSDDAGPDEGRVIWRSLPEGRSYLMRPLARGLCRFHELKDGSLGLEDIALMNDHLACEADNELRRARALN